MDVGTSFGRGGYQRWRFASPHRTEKAVPRLGCKGAPVLASANLESPQWRRKLGARPCAAVDLLWPPGAGFLAFGGNPHRGSGSGDPQTPCSPTTITENAGVKLTEAGQPWGATDREVHGGKVPLNCFQKGPGFPGHHGNPGVPSNALNNRAPGGQLATLASGSEACKALPSTLRSWLS